MNRNNVDFNYFRDIYLKWLSVVVREDEIVQQQAMNVKALHKAMDTIACEDYCQKMLETIKT